MPFLDKRAFDIKPGLTLPRFIYAFLGKHVKVLPENFLFRGDFAVPVKTAGKPRAKLAVSPLAELLELEDRHELLELKNRGARQVVRVHKIDFV